MNTIHIVILAGGKGTRMQATDMPKVMYPIKGKPMVGYIADMLIKAAIKDVVVVVGYQGQKVVDYLSSRDGFKFVWQKEQLGTGHALSQAKDLLKGKDGVTVVLNGDNPFFKFETIERMVKMLDEKQAVMVVSSVELDKSFSFGRIITNPDGHIQKIVEVKNATPEELEYTWMNAGLYAFDNNWLWKNIDKVDLDSISKEYYLTDMVAVANNQSDRVIMVPVTHENEAIGINTLDNLKAAEDILSEV